MAKLKIDYSEARNWYIKGDKSKEEIKYTSLPDIAREFKYSLSILRKKRYSNHFLNRTVSALSERIRFWFWAYLPNREI